MTDPIRRTIRIALWATLTLWASVATAASERIVAVGDVHGDYDSLLALLGEARLVDAGGAWSGGTASLVQLGDFLDRGPKTREVMDLLMRLEDEATAAGGSVRVLLGNHEALNLLHEIGDVGAESYASWADEASGQERELEYKDALETRRRRAALLDLPRPTTGSAAKRRWFDEHPPGLLPFLDSLAHGAKYGAWLRNLPVVARIDDILFLHGGLSPEVAKMSVEEVNRRARDELDRADRCRETLVGAGYLSRTSSGLDLVQAGTALVERLREKKELDTGEKLILTTLSHCEDFQDWFLLNADGPLWFRGYAFPTSDHGWSDKEGGPLIREVLEAQGVEHVVVGHTPQADGVIRSRFGGAVFLIDTGMLSSVYKGGRPSALEIVDGEFNPIYLAPPDSIAETDSGDADSWVWRSKSGEPHPFANEEEILEFLRHADIVDSQRIGTGINGILRLDLERDGIRARAAFRTVDREWRNQAGPDGNFHRLYRDSYAFEIAAFELSSALGFDRVPPTVERRYRNDIGSLQAWIENTRMEAEVIESGERAPDTAAWLVQRIERRMFDALIHNQDRNAGNTMYDDGWRLWLIDQGRSFLAEPAEDDIEALVRADRRLLDAIRTADRQAIRERLDPYLSAAELGSLFERWQQMIDHYDGLIAERGEAAVYYDP